ncbi:phage holin family protein [Microbacterium sp. LRZ72]|uniref:phage holin family protein n=1 Tax=Microbacterium sp. LRZ72 TaxID=2942481 RepID=UPI0029A736D4|nr:phage holin family protein [Microbacterium sp. LRZ72]MDX2377351.1 phage holin family protein [Microbacterium sp. LRZ72]
MLIFLYRTLVFVLSAALGLIAADLILPGFEIVWSDWWGFVLCVLIFAVLQSVLSPWIATMARRYAPVLLGGIGIISTLAALLIVVLLPIGGIRITDAVTWVLAPLIVWIITALATVLLPLIFLKRRLDDKDAGRDKRSNSR